MFVCDMTLTWSKSMTRGDRLRDALLPDEIEVVEPMQVALPLDVPSLRAIRAIGSSR